MSIYLNNIKLPDGLRFSDEFTWSPLTQATEYSLTGALIVHQGEKQAGRPITLEGGKDFAWLTRTEVAALKALLDAETWLNAEEAVTKGFADELQAELKVAAAFDDAVGNAEACHDPGHFADRVSLGQSAEVYHHGICERNGHV